MKRKIILMLIGLAMISLWLCGQRTYLVSWRMREVIQEDCCDTACKLTHYVYRDKGFYTKKFYRLDSAHRFYQAALQESKKVNGLMIHVRLEEQ